MIDVKQLTEHVREQLTRLHPHTIEILPGVRLNVQSTSVTFSRETAWHLFSVLRYLQDNNVARVEERDPDEPPTAPVFGQMPPTWKCPRCNHAATKTNDRTGRSAPRGEICWFADYLCQEASVKGCGLAFARHNDEHASQPKP